MNKKLVITLFILGVLIGYLYLTQEKQTISFQEEKPSNEYITDGSNNAVSNSTDESIKELIARVKRMERENQEKTARLTNLEKSKDSAIPTGAANVDQKLIIQLKNESNKQIAALKSEIESLKQNELNSFTGGDVPVVISEPTSNAGSVDVPTLVQPTDNEPITITTGTKKVADSDGIVWMEPDDAVYTTTREGQTQISYPVDFSKKITTNEKADATTTTNGTPESEKELENIPIYTIPSNSTLLNAVGMTAIIGRVPMAGTLTNPFRFKVLLGSKNLATNGLTIPNLESMVLSGTSSGDFTMECAQGDIDKATFTFRDGTVRTMEGSGDSKLGWISDEYGTPCISGQYISNFMSYVATVGSLSTLGAVADAIAQSNVTTVTDGGGIGSAVTGNSLQYGIGQGINKGAQEIVKWFADRQESAFDAVFIPVGKKLTVHIEETLEIDFETKGRKLVHEENMEKYL